MKFHNLRGLNNKTFLIVLDAGKSEIKVLADLVPGESTLPGLYTADFLLCLHMAERVCA